VLEALTTCEQVVGDVQDVIRLVVRLVDLQQLHSVVDLVVQPHCLHHVVNQRHTACRDRSNSPRDLVRGSRTAQHRPAVVVAILVLPVEPMLDPTLEQTEPFAYLALHSKRPPWRCCRSSQTDVRSSGMGVSSDFRSQRDSTALV